MNNDQIKKMIQEHEGYVGVIYEDSVGNPTCGWGHLLDNGSRVPKAAAEVFFNQDFNSALADFMALVRQYNLDLGPLRRAVLIDMLFNMGFTRVRGFRKMLAALQVGDFECAADEMLDSKWAIQVGNRAIELSRLMREGEVQ